MSATIWPPMLAVTFAKVASAMVLLGWGEREWWRTAATAAIAWAAVQSHVPGTFVAAAVLLYLVVQPLITSGWRAALTRAIVVGSVVAIMQIPWAVYWINQPPGTLGTPVGGSLASIAKGEQAPRIATSALAFGRAFSFIQGRPWQLPLGWILASCALIVTILLRRNPAVLAVSVGSLAMGCGGPAAGCRHDSSHARVPSSVARVTRDGGARAAAPEHRSAVHRGYEQPDVHLRDSWWSPVGESPWVAVVEPDGEVRYERSAASR